MKLVPRSTIPPRCKKRSSARPKDAKPTWTVKKWTGAIGAIGAHEVWATLNGSGEPVAFGSESKMRQYVAKLTESDGTLYDPNNGA